MMMSLPGPGPISKNRRPLLHSPLAVYRVGLTYLKFFSLLPILMFWALGIEPRASSTLCKCSSTRAMPPSLSICILVLR